MPTPSPSRPPFLRFRRPLWAVLAAALVLAQAPAPAAAATEVHVVLKDGTKLTADLVYYTYTDLVVVSGSEDMRMVPNGEVLSVDGVPFEKAYWEHKTPVSDIGDAPKPAASGPTAEGVWPMKTGTFRRYDMAKSITTWIRHGTDLQKRTTQAGAGSVIERIEGPSGSGGQIEMTETIHERVDGKSTHVVRLTDQLQPRADGYYLTTQSMEDDQLRIPHLSDTISTPPRLWPNNLEVGQEWIVGPFERMGLNQVGRMKVVDRESVTVPAGTYPDAFKITGYGHVFDGTQLLVGGRLVTDHGTLESTTWFVPGLGAVKEESKLHIHQDYFPSKPNGAEIPLVVEEETTRSLAEYQIGR